jgi:hypothetical protein
MPGLFIAEREMKHDYECGTEKGMSYFNVLSHHSPDTETSDRHIRCAENATV